MHIDWWTIGLQTINVLVLIWLLKRFLLQPVATAIESRRTTIDKLLGDAETAKLQAQAKKADAENEISALKKTHDDILKTANDQADAVKAALLADARTQAEQLRATADADIVRLRKDAAKANTDHAKDLAIAIAEKLFARLPDEAKITGFLAGLSQVLAEMPESERRAIADAAPLTIKSPRMMTDAELKYCTAQMSASLGKPVDIAVEVDPNLIAGLEIDTPHALVRNSFRADLERIALELSRDDNER
jgi:F-type H+-transporting ATPase subunit b